MLAGWWRAVTVDRPAQGCRCLLVVGDWPTGGDVYVQLEPRLCAVKHEHDREMGVCYCQFHHYWSAVNPLREMSRQRKEST